MAIVKKTKKIQKDTKKEIEKSPTDILDVPKPNEDVYKLVSYIYEINFEKEYQTIKEWLNNRPDTPSQLEDCLFDAGPMLNKTKCLIEHVTLETKKYNLECDERMEILRTNALESLENEKRELDRKKQITNQMIEDRILADYSKLYTGIKQKQNELKSVLSLIENLYEQVKNREINLRKILDSKMFNKGRPSWANRKE